MWLVDYFLTAFVDFKSDLDDDEITGHINEELSEDLNVIVDDGHDDFLAFPFVEVLEIAANYLK